jgi:hypothetical protein
MKKGLYYLIIGIVLVMIGSIMKITIENSVISSYIIGLGLFLELIFLVYLIIYLKNK